MKANLAVMQVLKAQIDGIEAILSKQCRRGKDYRHYQSGGPDLRAIRAHF